MMAAAISNDTEIECGFCWRRNDALEDPRVLPCSHVHCLGCLNAYFELHHIVQCPLPGCREVFDVATESLPNYETTEDTTSLCDVCIKKGRDNHPAVVYCVDCSKKLCVKHQEFHEEMNDGHSAISIEKYKHQSFKLEAKTCSQHDDKPYSLGCKVCLKLLCEKCFDNTEDCTNGKPHCLLFLDSLVAFLSEEIGKLKSELKSKEGRYEKLFKTTSRILSEYDEKTKEMLQTLWKTRDEQIESIRLKYDQLEAELIKRMEQTKEEIGAFLNTDVGVKWLDLRNHGLKLDARMKHSHQCDIVKRYEETKEEMQELVNEELPTLHFQNMISLGTKDKKREIELEIISEESRYLDIEGLIPSTTPAKSLSLLKSVSVSSYPRSVCHYKGSTYVGLEDYTIASIDNTYQLTTYRSFPDRPEGIAVYKDKIYFLVYGDPYQVIVQDLNGIHITQWNHIDNDIFNKLAIVTDQVVIPDRKNKHLSVYSLTGQIIKQIAVPQLSGGDYLAACAVGDNSVVVSDHSSSKVFMVDIASGKVMWTCSDIARPEGVTRDRGKHIYVASRSTSKIYILDIKTGAVLAELCDNAIESGNTHIFDLHISGDTLIVPLYDNKKVQYFKMNKQ